MGGWKEAFKGALRRILYPFPFPFPFPSPILPPERVRPVPLSQRVRLRPLPSSPYQRPFKLEPLISSP